MISERKIYKNTNIVHISFDQARQDNKNEDGKDEDGALQVFTQPGLSERATHSVKLVI